MKSLQYILPVSLVLVACGGTDEPAPHSPELEVTGAYSSLFGEEKITATKWGFTTIVEYDNEANVAITQNPADDMFNPSEFNRIVWTEKEANGAFYYCFVDFGMPSAEAAKTSTATFDASAPATGGCGGFPWTELYVPIEIEGRYHSNYGGVELVSHRRFSFQNVITFDNDTNTAITQSPPDDMFNPSKFSKIVWTEKADGRFFYCAVTFGEDTAEAATNTTEMADDTNPAEDGCGGFPWTELAPTIEIEGRYDSNFGTEESITSDMWGSSTVRAYDNDENVAYLQLPEDDMFNPDTFTKIVWTEPTDGVFHYCWVDFGLATIEEAQSSTAAWDASEPDVSGCGGFPWTKLTPQ